jgi:3-hydroxyisobutyrate dehydrogenase
MSNEAAAIPTIGVIGLGLIGAALAQRLARTGAAPLVFDLRADAVQTAVATGAIAAQSSAELAASSDIVLVCVQTDAQCVAAVSGEAGVLSGARRGSCVAVISTVLPATITTLAERAAAQGVQLVDTPVAGRGKFSIDDGSISVLVGDDGVLADRLEPVLLRFASHVVRAGRLGSGAALKLAHNVIVFAGFAATIEAVELARVAGVRDGLVEEVARTSGALSTLSEFHIPYYKHFRDEPHAPSEDEVLRIAAALAEKDLGDAVALGEEHGLDLPVARLLSHEGKRMFPAGT